MFHHTLPQLYALATQEGKFVLRLESLLLKVVLIRVDARIAFSGGPWLGKCGCTRTFTFYHLLSIPLGRLGQGPGAPPPLPGHPCKHRSPQLEEVVAGT